MDSSDSSLYLFGGFSRGSSNLADLWRFEPENDRWTEIRAIGETPTARGYAALANAPLIFPGLETSGLALFGGCRCDPGCSCFNDLWYFNSAAARWVKIQQEKPIIARYKGTGFWLADSSSFLVFGGESFRPHHYFNEILQFPLRALESEWPREWREKTGEL